MPAFRFFELELPEVAPDHDHITGRMWVGMLLVVIGVSLVAGGRSDTQEPRPPGGSAD